MAVSRQSQTLLLSSSRVGFSFSFIKTVACMLLLCSATSLLANRRARSMESIRKVMTGQRSNAVREISKKMHSKLEVMFRSSSTEAIESFAKHLESKSFETELSFRDLANEHESFRKQEIARLEKSGKTAELMLAKANLETFTTKELTDKPYSKRSKFEALESGGTKEVLREKAAVIETILRLPKISQSTSQKLLAIVKTQLQTALEISMMHTMLKLAANKVLETSMVFEAAFKNIVQRHWGKEKEKELDKCMKSVGGGMGGGVLAPAL